MNEIKENVRLSQFTSFRIGGPARFFAEVSSVDALREAILFARNRNIPHFLLGAGSNILVSDDGFNGLVIKLDFQEFSQEGNSFRLGASTILSRVAREISKRGYSGLEWAAGVPGTIGGAAAINAGCFGGEFSEVVQYVEVIDLVTFEKRQYLTEECEYSYRSSRFKGRNDVAILSVSLTLESMNAADIEAKIKEISAKRKIQQPQALSAGSYFKKSLVESEAVMRKIEKMGGTLFEGDKVAPGWLIERAGLKGKKMGGAMVSDVHANFLVNTGGATAEDVLELAEFVKEEVYDKFGIRMEEEVYRIGF